MRIHKKTLFLPILAILVVVTCSVSAASRKEAKQAEEKLQQVALFKNGLGFFTSEVTCPDKKDTFSFIPAVAATHGTFWVAYPAKVELTNLTAKEVELEESIEAISIEELLRANVGKEVELSFDNKGESAILGLLSCFTENRSQPQPSPYAPRRIVQSPVRASLIIVKTKEGDIAIDSQAVKMVKVIDGKLEKTFTSKSKSMQLDVKLRASAGGKKLTVSYLAKGITWAPSYIVDITDANEAKISAKAIVINEALDLDDVTIQLVTGFPNLQFADVVSPLAMKENLAQFLQALIRRQSEQGRMGVTDNVMSQRTEAHYRSDLEAEMPAYGAAKAGKVAEDLFLYPVNNVRLAKGEVGYLPLFTESVPYKHIYQWKIPDYVDEEDRYSYNRRGGEEEPVEEVWHCLRMGNTTKVPWTTAPAETVKEGIILGQDTLEYTPTKAETTLKITQAVSVKAEQVELETDRKRDAVQFYGYHYDLVTVEGELSVTNFQQKDITLEITKILSGEVKLSQPEAKVETLAKGLKRVNPNKKLTWTINLEAGGSTQLDYTYEVYVKR
jgi:hypothetical protein